MISANNKSMTLITHITSCLFQHLMKIRHISKIKRNLEMRKIGQNYHWIKYYFKWLIWQRVEDANTTIDIALYNVLRVKNSTLVVSAIMKQKIILCPDLLQSYSNVIPVIQNNSLSRIVIRVANNLEDIFVVYAN